MNKKSLFISLVILQPLLLGAGEGVDLRRCYGWARERDESIRSLELSVVRSRARARAAVGGALPSLDWNLSATHQDPDGVDKLEQKGFTGFVEENQVESKLTLKQPLFSGLREFTAISGFRRESARDARRLERAGRELFQRTAEAFYDVLEREADRDNAAAALDLARRRVSELEGFKRLGKARDSEVFAARARAAALEAQVERHGAEISSARAALSDLTGQDMLALPLEDSLPMPAPGDVQEALSKARERSDILAAREDAAAQRLRVRYEKGARWPTADVTGNYYTQRAAFMDDIAWDLGLTLKVPLFAGGSPSARAREASAAHQQALLALENAERRAALEVRRVHGDLGSALREASALESAAEAARRGYEALSAEYRLGLVTNLEVTEALDFLLIQKTARDAARFKAKRLAVRLGVATETLP